jgi:hypothetical protein
LNENAAAALDAAWEAEIAQRLAAYDRGEVQAIDAEWVFARAPHSKKPPYWVTRVEGQGS